jgi:thiol-disulfide isomerase/thioredoxin
VTPPRVAGLGIGSLFTVLLVWNLGFVVTRCDELRPVRPGDVAPDVSFYRAAGPPVSLGELRGKVVLIDFWATWCGPCRKSMPAVERLHLRFPSLAVLSVNTEPPSAAQAAQKFADGLKISTPILFDRAGAAAAFRVQAIPHLVLIDRLGIVRHVHVGELTDEGDLAARIEALETTSPP